MILAKKINCLICLILLAASCSGKAPLVQPSEGGFTFLFGSTTKGVSVEQTGNAISVIFSNVAAEGVFVRVPTEQGHDLLRENWVGADDLVHLAVSYKGGIEIGVVPLSGYQGTSVAAELLTGISKDPSVPPVGEGNVISDLSVTDAGGGQVLLDPREE